MILQWKYWSLSTKKLDDWGRGYKIIQNCLTSFMDDPLLVIWQDLDRIDRHSGKTVLTHQIQLVVEALEET